MPQKNKNVAAIVLGSLLIAIGAACPIILVPASDSFRSILELLLLAVPIVFVQIVCMILGLYLMEKGFPERIDEDEWE